MPVVAHSGAAARSTEGTALGTDHSPHRHAGVRRSPRPPRWSGRQSNHACGRGATVDVGSRPFPREPALEVVCVPQLVRADGTHDWMGNPLLDGEAESHCQARTRSTSFGSHPPDCERQCPEASAYPTLDATSRYWLMRPRPVFTCALVSEQLLPSARPSSLHSRKDRGRQLPPGCPF